MYKINLNHIAKVYLKKLGFKKKYNFKKRRCEVCNSNNNKLLQKKISIGNNKFLDFPIAVCEKCGFVFQAIKFEKNFYKDFYRRSYRQNIYKDVKPSQSFINRQKIRAKHLFKFLNSNFKLKKNGSILDIGCSVGEFLRPFIKKGWNCFGNDPDKNFVEYGRKYLNLPIKFEMAENMNFKNKFDLTIIIGSLEHCFDPNKVLKKIYKYSNKNAMILISGRGIPRSSNKIYFNHNHHRYFSYNSMELILMKHGFKPIFSTIYPITGIVEERKNEIFCIAVKHPSYFGKLKKFIQYSKIETYKTIEYFYKNSEKKKTKQYLF
tara:strand:- start:142 stop:1101 length:960 start_codon:yes stop_codon:yes gene_type:complete